MSDLAVIRATFSDWRTVKGRKMLQIIFEVPLEQQGDVLTRLGAPDPSDPRWCAIALLDLAKAAEPQKEPNPAKSEAAKERYRQLPEWSKAAQRAALLCKDRKFREWLGAHWGYTRLLEEDAAEVIRAHFHIQSRSEIATDERAYAAFITLEQEFRMATGQAAEARG